ncbi:hypothetical protein K435DRAFT_856031 [Dendrothele bispora CBS 962.96]|uniref:Fungal-type protein kinase domain-containing protein n=1 Tax=Dendrothele bispora (strain CBS 962.96) TaxID=1314807 RepID=A0A4S8M9I7_DENBC|nr:hypothetical protein K435DRAFT_856031 [Dendrothele bispora CBS 962.96]
MTSSVLTSFALTPLAVIGIASLVKGSITVNDVKQLLKDFVEDFRSPGRYLDSAFKEVIGQCEDAFAFFLVGFVCAWFLVTAFLIIVNGRVNRKTGNDARPARRVSFKSHLKGTTPKRLERNSDKYAWIEEYQVSNHSEYSCTNSFMIVVGFKAGYADKDLINLIGRTVIHDAFCVNETRDIATLEPVSRERLALFDQDPSTFGPHDSMIRLDTSPDTALTMTDSVWNRAVVQMLGDRATNLAHRYHSISNRLSGEYTVDWHGLFRSRLHDVFLEIAAARQSSFPYLSALAANYDKKKHCNKQRRERSHKFSTRRQICATMTRHLRETGNNESLIFWNAALIAVERLDIDGMSDQETIEEGGEQIKVVKHLVF